MSYCFNLQCPNPTDPANKNQLVCCNCGFDLLLQNRYRILRQLGRCEFDNCEIGKTFEIVDNHTGTNKVLRVLLKPHPKLAFLQQKPIAFFEHEVKVLCQLKHPGIPRVEQDGYFTFMPKESKEPVHCLVMEKIEGLLLEDWMTRRNNKPISEKLALKWLKQMVKILDEFHCKNYYFRDINSKAITLKPDGNLALTDYQMLRQRNLLQGLLQVLAKCRPTGIVSPGCLVPENITSRNIATDDFFWLGRMWVFLLTGKPEKAFPENPRTGKLLWRKYAPHISQHFADLLDYLMATFPGNRPQNCQVILKCIRDIKQEQAKITSNYQETSQTKTQENKNKKKNTIISDLINKLNQCWTFTWNLLRKMSSYLGLLAK
ncbi:protein kinase [Lyngbya sp. PCC 8106]|uniref:serine/threonine protein kinase n=1 Tax=Lyngbya sp. (strain PCC 8106) TaxID=313612 RepID=UPI0000EACE94|nr:protein kinase [Lyngbya sp. PCC 8106]EAW36058.1 Serine/Threonine protein kinase [Lyngbya sp. PCC 8106]